MKKKCAIFLTLIFILQGILVSAAERITVRVTVSGKTVTISGQLQKPKDNAVGILVTNRNGDIIYAAVQATSASKFRAMLGMTD